MIARAATLLVCLDFDGTLAELDPDPYAVRLHPGAEDAIRRLAALLPADEDVGEAPAQEDTASPLSVLRRDTAERGSKRDAAYQFDLGIQGFYVVQSPEEATQLFAH